eukprot:scaffold9.g3229.t1
MLSDWLLLELSSLCLVGLAAASILGAAVRALHHDLAVPRAGPSAEDDGITISGPARALAVPLLASAGLLLVYFFFQQLQFLLLALACAGSAAAVVFTAAPLLEATAAARGWRWPAAALPARCRCCGGGWTAADAALAGAGSLVVLAWLATGSWLLNNLLGCCLAMVFASLVCSLLLTALLVYDILFVFYSPRVFQKNVMVEAATKQAVNPVRLAAEALELPGSGSIAPQLQLPVKLLMPARLSLAGGEPYLMLGLGDIALPSTLLALLLCVDYRRSAKAAAAAAAAAGRASGRGGLARAGSAGGRGGLPPGSSAASDGGSTAGSGGGGAAGASMQQLRSWKFWRGSYAGAAWCGYWAGVAASLAAGLVFEAAQPAMLYVVPCCLLPVLALGAARGDLAELWGGQRLSLLAGKEGELDV